VTVGCIEVPLAEAKAFGVMKTNRDNRILEFQEKPANPQSLPGRPDVALASMGIYIFNTDVLCRELVDDQKLSDSTHDFGSDIIPSLLQRRRVFAFPFRDPTSKGQGYWRDVGTVDAFWAANLELIDISPELNLYDSKWPIWTYQEQLPPAKFVFDDDERRGMAVDSMIAGGCIVSGSVVRHSLLFSHVHVHSYCNIEDSVIFPDVTIGRHCDIRRAVLDRGCILAPGEKIGVDLEADRKRFHVTENGVVLVTPEMLGQDFHHAI
jgi:glucose-1-phosphate adenylyltransferase